MRFSLLFSIVLFFLIQNLNAQLSIAEQDQLAQLLTEKVNALRISKGKQPLERHIDLAKAAKLHSDYMAEKNQLTHTQTGTLYPNPSDRVFNFNKSFTTIGENALFQSWSRFPLSEKELEVLASNMYRSWRNSKGHYANMISGKFTFGDFGFAYNEKSKRLYATQVFAKKGYIINGQLSNNAFGIQPQDISCDNIEGFHDNIIVNIGNAITINYDEIFLAYHDIDTIKEIFINPEDGIAVDLVQRDQLKCGEDNKLDASTIYDGVLLKPIYKDQLLASNTAQNPKRFVASLGKVPKALLGKKLSANIIIIKDGKKCSYTVPSSIPSKRYKLRPIEPEILNPKIELKTEGINGIHEVNFDFKSGQTVSTNSPEISVKKETIYGIDIKSFTSVDGSSESNEKLHLERANFIKAYTDNHFQTDAIPTTIEAKENWDLCFYHLEILGLDETLGKDKQKIKDYLQKNLNIEWNKALSLQRKSKAIIYTNGSWEKSAPYFLNYNLTDALLTKNYPLANKALAEMYYEDNINLFLNEEFIIENLFNKQELVQNVSALLLKNVEYYDLDNIVFFVRNWLSKPDLLSEKAQKNLLNLYTITAKRLLANWDTATEDFSKVLHPEKVEPLFKNYKTTNKTNPLFLNFHMASIDYYAQINFSPKIRVSFDFIADYFKKQSKSIKDDTDLGLFFNSWSMYHMTIESLMRRLYTKRLDEDSAFLLAKTYSAYKMNYHPNITLKINEQAIQFDKERWCTWITKDFQNLRNEDIKDLYCNTCNNK